MRSLILYVEELVSFVILMEKRPHRFCHSALSHCHSRESGNLLTYTMDSLLRGNDTHYKLRFTFSSLRSLFTRESQSLLNSLVR